MNEGRRINEEEINAFKHYLMIMPDEKYNVFKEKTGLDRDNLISKIINSDYTKFRVDDQDQYYGQPRNVNYYEFKDIFPNAVVFLTFVSTQPIDVYFYIDKDLSEPSNTQSDGRSSKKKKKKLPFDGTNRDSLETDLKNLKFRLIELEAEMKKTNETMIQKQNQLQVYKDIEQQQAENLANLAGNIWKGGQYIGKKVGYLFGMGGEAKNKAKTKRSNKRRR